MSTITKKAFADMASERKADARAINKATKKASALYDSWFASGVREGHFKAPSTEGSRLNEAEWIAVQLEAVAGFTAQERDALMLGFKDYCSKYKIDKAVWLETIKPLKLGALKNARKNTLHVWRTAMKSRAAAKLTPAQRKAAKRKPTKILNYRHEVDKMMEWVEDINDPTVNVKEIQTTLNYVRSLLPEAINAETPEH